MTIDPKIALLVSKSAPIVATVMFISSVESAGADPWAAVWKVSLSTGFGAFLVLIGLVYTNMEKRVSNTDERVTKLEETRVHRDEYKDQLAALRVGNTQQLEDLKEWTKNVERKIDRLIERRH